VVDAAGIRLAQLSLFRPAESVLVEDARGRIEYRPGFLDTPTAERWFAELREGTSWQAERRMMYDREVDVPRLTAHLQLAPEETLPPAIREAAERVSAATGVAFTSVGLNLYRDGWDSVAPHNDHLDILVKGFPIALLSLGSARRMTIRAKQPPKRVLQLDLEPGSLLLMSYETQLHYTHAIPKTRDPVGPRISLAFRVKPADDAGGY
jgi:alkylated DNA repair dioxygenase AlkB